MARGHGRGPSLALGIVRLASLLLPNRARRGWLREWEGELFARWEELEAADRLTLAARADLLARAAGSVVDALFYGDGRWRMDGFVQDVGVALRSLARRPSLTLVVIATLALGIGANTAMFSVASDVLLRPFPYPRPDQVVAVESMRLGAVGPTGNVGYPNVYDLGEAASTLEAVGATRWWTPALEDERGSIVLRGATVTSNFFGILGVSAGLGRFFAPEEQWEGREPLVVLSHRFWTGHLGGDSGVLGRERRLNGTAYRVIGVTAADYEDPWIMGGPGVEPQVFRTVGSGPADWPRSGRSWKGIARIQDGVALEAAQDEVDALFAGLAAEYPQENQNRIMRLLPLRDRIAGPAQPVLIALLGAVGMLLLIACANLASLMLGRALDRQGEFAVHKALGAPGWRLFNRGLAEAGVLSVIGGGLGLALAQALVSLAQGFGSLLPRPVSGDLDLSIFSFAAATALGAGLLFGLAPALHAARTETSAPGRDIGRSATMSRRGHRFRRALVVGQLALTTALLVGAGLLVRSFQELGAVDLGMDVESVVAIELHGSAWFDLEAEASQAQWDAIMEAVGGVPGVEAAGAIDYVPLSGDYSCDGLGRADRPRPPPGEGICAETRMVLPGAVETLGVPLIRGRLILDSDRADQPLVVVIDQNLQEALWPDEDPLGKPLWVHGSVHEVVGVAANMLHFGPDGDVLPQLYLPAAQDGWNGISRGLALLARGDDPEGLIRPIQAAVARVNPAIATGTARTLEGYLANSLAAARFRTALMIAFGLTALLLAVLGIAGVMSYSVARRTREMGIRLALGAEPLAVRGLVLREGVRLGVLGVALGLAVAAPLAGRLEQLLFGVSIRDPGVYIAVVLLLGTATAVACSVPAGRASRVDPVTALSAE